MYTDHLKPLVYCNHKELSSMSGRKLERSIDDYVKQLKECASGKGDKMQEAIDGICLCIHQLPVEVAYLKDTISDVIYILSEVVSYLEAKNSNLERDS